MRDRTNIVLCGLFAVLGIGLIIVSIIEWGNIFTIAIGVIVAVVSIWSLIYEIKGGRDE